MALIQKLNIDKEVSNQYQLILSDETGIFSASNSGGYGGNNSLSSDQIFKYIFEIKNMNTNDKYKYVYSPLDIVTPTIEEIVNKYKITLLPYDNDNSNIDMFSDGVYKVTMNVCIGTLYSGDGFVGQDSIINVTGAKALYENYNSIEYNNNVYKILDYEGSTLFIDRNIEEEFHTFSSILSTSNNVIIYDKLIDCITSKIARFVDNCDKCPDLSLLNRISELQILDWGVKYSIDTNDFIRAKEYLDYMYKLCSSSNCDC